MLLDPIVPKNENLLFFLTPYLSKDTKLVPMTIDFGAFSFFLALCLQISECAAEDTEIIQLAVHFQCPSRHLKKLGYLFSSKIETIKCLPIWHNCLHFINSIMGKLDC